MDKRTLSQAKDALWGTQTNWTDSEGTASTHKCKFLELTSNESRSAFNFATSEAKDSGKGTAYQDYKNKRDKQIKFAYLADFKLLRLKSNV